jgi:hypothetical protein
MVDLRAFNSNRGNLKVPACEERERGRGRDLKQNFYSFYEQRHK